MPDITLRFHKDMLVLSSPVAVVLARQGFDVEHDLEFANLVEPEAVRDALRLNKMAGAQCLVANAEGIAPARLAHRGMEDRAAEIVRTGLSLARELKSQHVLVEIGPCGLPLDAASKSSLNENRDQYARAARACDGQEFDAFFLNGFANPADLKCALMGVRQVSGAPVFASVDVDADGMLADGRHTFEDALAVMVDYEASVVGFATAAPLDAAVTFARRASGAGRLPVLAQLIVREHNPKQGDVTHENPYYCPDVLVGAAVQLRAAGAQFLRAVPPRRPMQARSRRPAKGSTLCARMWRSSMVGSNTVRSPHYGALQDVVDSLYLGLGPKEKLRRLDIVVAAEAADLPDDLAEIVNLLPPGSYTRQRLCDQLNSAIGGHAWGQVYGTVQ